MWLAAFVAFLIIVAGFFIISKDVDYQLSIRDGVKIQDSTFTTIAENNQTAPESQINFDSILETELDIEETAQETEALTQETGSSTIYYDIPLSDEVQDIVFDICNQYGVPSEVIFAMMAVESRFDPAAIGNSGELGYMQILPSTGASALSCLGIDYSWDPEMNNYIAAVLSEPRNNIECSAYLMNIYLNRYNSLNLALMCYNSGEGGAQALWGDGIYDTYYSIEVINTISLLSKR